MPSWVTTHLLNENVEASLSVDSGVKSLEETTIAGREFDLLRFEKKLLLKDRIYLGGPGSVGKSAFLQYSCKMWKSIAFFFVSIVIDLETIMSSSRKELLISVLQHILLSIIYDT